MKKSWFVIAAAIPLVAIGSIAVWELSGNDQRRLGMITSASQPVSLAWRGPWDAEAKYVPGEVVSYQGSSYVAETETGGVNPDPKECTGENCPWATLGAKAQPGPAGAGFRWLGPQSDAEYCDKLYQPGDVVQHEGSSWVIGGEHGIGGCVSPPHSPWQLLAKKGADGPQGSPGLSGYQIVEGSATIPDGKTWTRETLWCPAGKKAFNGGAFRSVVTGEAPRGPNAQGLYGWEIYAERDTATGADSFWAYVVCAKVS